MADIPNILLTPHIYGASNQVVDHQSEIITSKIFELLKKESFADQTVGDLV